MRETTFLKKSLHFDCTIVLLGSKCFIFIVLSCFFYLPGQWCQACACRPGPRVLQAHGLGPEAMVLGLGGDEGPNCIIKLPIYRDRADLLVEVW